MFSGGPSGMPVGVPSFSMATSPIPISFTAAKWISYSWPKSKAMNLVFVNLFIKFGVNWNSWIPRLMVEV